MAKYVTPERFSMLPTGMHTLGMRPSRMWIASMQEHASVGAAILHWLLALMEKSIQCKNSD
jgi:hypothetical protein